MAKRNRAEEDELPKAKLDRTSLAQMRRLLVYLRPYRGMFLLGLLVLVVSGGITLAFPKVTGDLVNAATGTTEKYDRNTIALFLVGILVLQSIVSYARVQIFAWVSERTLRDLRRDVYTKIITLPISFFEQRRVGELTSRITADVSQLQDTLSLTLAEFIRQVTTLIVGVAIILITSTKLTLVMLSTFPVMMVAATVFGRYIRRLSRQVSDELARTNTIAEETLQGIQTVKSFTNEAYEATRYTAGLQQVMQLALSTARYRGAFVSFVIFSIFGGIVLVMWYGLGLVAEKQLLIGDLISFLLYTLFIGASAGGLGDLYGQLQKTAGATQRILEILDEPSELAVAVPSYDTQGAVVPQAPQAEPTRLAGRVRFEGVRFRYPARPDIEVLRGLTLEMEPGQAIALVGQSGAGKSTIAQLLMRFHTATEGQIYIDGHPIQDYELTALRSQIGIVPQDVLLFGGSLRENIGYGRPTATDEQIRDAARRANALGFIEAFPEGLDTLVGERGVKLSGGQRQRIAIARAILKDPAILILDEATNALDAESESLVQQALDELMHGRTTLVIAHRLNTIRQADKILVISEGQVAEQGSHAELSTLPEGRYANLLKLQMEDYGVEN